MKSIWVTAIACACIFTVLVSGAQSTGIIRAGQGGQGGPGGPGYTETIEKTFTVNQGGKLSIDADLGSVRIETSTSNTVKVLVEKRLKEGTEEQARSAFEDVDVKIEGRNGGVSIRVDKKRWIKRNRVSVMMKVRVPEAFNLKIDTKGGNIDIEDLAGEVLAETAGGNVTVGNTKGGVTARTLGGSVRVGHTEGDVEARTMGGNIEIGDVKGDVQAKTLGGSIRVGHAEGDVQARTMGGNINVDSAVGEVSAWTLGGKVSIGST